MRLCLDCELQYNNVHHQSCNVPWCDCFCILPDDEDQVVDFLIGQPAERYTDEWFWSNR